MWRAFQLFFGWLIRIFLIDINLLPLNLLHSPSSQSVSRNVAACKSDETCHFGMGHIHRSYPSSDNRYILRNASVSFVSVVRKNHKFNI